MSIKTVIFDLGRVLLSLGTDGEKFTGLMRKIGVAPADAFKTFWRDPLVLGHSRGDIGPHDFYEGVRHRFHIDMDYKDFAAAWCDLFAPIPGMEDLFNQVADRYPVGILSDTDALHWAKAKELLPCLSRVKKPTLSYQVGALKPDEAMYRAAVNAAHVDAGECLFIDDVQANVNGALQYGMQALLFTGVDDLRRDLKKLAVLP